jgi:NADH dehydrogenase FAD-containing subunit
VKSFEFGESGLVLDIDEGSEESLTTDTLIFATGQQSELNDLFGVELTGCGFVKVNENMMTSVEGVFAAGDVVYGTKSVVEAIASGREAAINIDRYLGGDGDIEEILFEREPLDPWIGKIEGFARLERIACLQDEASAKQEAVRCLQCDLRLHITKVKLWVDPHFQKKAEEVRQ